MLVSCDIYRPAAIQQLETLSEQVGALFHPSTPAERPVERLQRLLDVAVGVSGRNVEAPVGHRLEDAIGHRRRGDSVLHGLVEPGDHRVLDDGAALGFDGGAARPFHVPDAHGSGVPQWDQAPKLTGPAGLDLGLPALDITESVGRFIVGFFMDHRSVLT